MEEQDAKIQQLDAKLDEKAKELDQQIVHSNRRLDEHALSISTIANQLTDLESRHQSATNGAHGAAQSSDVTNPRRLWVKGFPRPMRANVLKTHFEQLTLAIPHALLVPGFAPIYGRAPDAKLPQDRSAQ